jgi:hypothetical protein
VAVALDAAAQDLHVLGQAQPVAEAGRRVVAGVVMHAAVQRGDAAGRDQLALELGGIQRLDQQVVGPGLHRLARGGLVGGAREHDHVGIVRRHAAADRARQRGAVHAGHLPVGDHDLRRLGLEAAPGLDAVLGHRALVPEPLDGGAHHEPRGGVVVGDQDVHMQTIIGRRGQTAQPSADSPGDR